MSRESDALATADDLDLASLQVNVVSTGLLACLLLPKLSQNESTASQSFKPHLSIVASDAHVWAALKPRDNVIGHLKSEAGFSSSWADPEGTYGVSKSKTGLWDLSSAHYETQCWTS